MPIPRARRDPSRRVITRDASASQTLRDRRSCPSAHTAAPRTSGLASDNNRSASVARAPSPELPIAISTLRMKRSRPMRLTGDLVKRVRNAASSSRASSDNAGARNSSRAASFVSRPACGELVPRAHREAIVAAIDAVADRFAEFVRDRSLVLDGEIGDAAPRIELVGRGKCRRRTDVEAGPAGAAMIGLGIIARQLERGEDRAEKQPRAELARHEIGVLALPAQPRRLRQRLFHHGGGVDEHLDLAIRRCAASQRASAFRRFLMTS